MMMNHEEDEILYRFDNGDEIRRNRKGKTVFVQFQKTKKVVSTSLINGAFHDDLKLVFNYKCGERIGPCMTLQQYEEDIKKKRKVSERKLIYLRDLERQQIWKMP